MVNKYDKLCNKVGVMFLFYKLSGEVGLKTELKRLRAIINNIRKIRFQLPPPPPRFCVYTHVYETISELIFFLEF